MSEEKKQELKQYQKQRYQKAKESKNNEQNSFFNNDLIVYTLFSSIIYVIINTLLGFHY